MKEFGFRLLDKVTGAVVKDWEWLGTPLARAHVIRQNTQKGLYRIEEDERENVKRDA